MHISTISEQRKRGAYFSRRAVLVGSLILSVALVACSDDASPTDDASNPQANGIEIAGAYRSGFGALETIGEQSWTVSSEEFGSTVSKIASYDNAKNSVITQNLADAAYSPSAFNKIVWTDASADGSFFYCTIEFGLASVEEAQASDAKPDESDPATAGCAGFAWTKLTPETSN